MSKVFFLDPTRAGDFTVVARNRSTVVVARKGDRHGRMEVPAAEWRAFLDCSERLCVTAPTGEPGVVKFVVPEADEPVVPEADEPVVDGGESESAVTQPDPPAEGEKQPDPPAVPRETKAQRRAREAAEKAAAEKE